MAGIEISISADIMKYKPKFAIGMTVRQCLCSGGAALLSVPTYFFLNQYFVQEFSIFVSTMLATPLIACGWFEPYNMPFEKYMKIAVRTLFINPKRRSYKATNTFEELFNAYDLNEEGELVEKVQEKTKGKKKNNKKNTPAFTKKNAQVSSDPELACCD